MIPAAPPLRFLMMVVLGWALFRALIVGGHWWRGDPDSPRHLRAEALPQLWPSASRANARTGHSADEPPREASISDVIAAGPAARHDRPESRPAFDLARAEGREGRFPATMNGLERGDAGAPPERAGRRAAGVPPRAPALAAPQQAWSGHWSGSAFLFVRRGEGAALAAGGTLGGGQAGGRVLYRLNRDPGRPLSLSGRVYVPLDDAAAAEVAVGVDWKPVAGLPVHLLAERRQAIGSRGRSDFAITAYGGVGPTPVAGPVLAEAYAQAGIVGAERRDAFVDAAARAFVPLDAEDRFRIGLGVWGAAQPRAARLDVGPQASTRLGNALRLTAEWRIRIAGDASPGSGPALTIAGDF